LVMLVMLASVTSIWLLPILLALIVANVCFHRLVKRPTVEGRKVMDQIEGFRTYLATAEQEPLEYATAPGAPPQYSAELFERHLPYAAALDVENAWAHRLSQVMDRLDVDKDFRLPMWFQPGQRSSLGPAGFAWAVGGSFLEALSAALKQRRSRGGETGPVKRRRPSPPAGKAKRRAPE
jgi:hypothetical protein